MRRFKKARKMAVILASVLVIDSLVGYVSPHIESMAYMERPATVNASSLNVRSGPGTTCSAVTKLTNGAAVTVIDEKTASDGALWYQIRFKGSGGAELTGYVSKSYLKFPASYTSDAGFEAQLNAEGFPESYKIRLRQMHAQYPKWVFRAQHTNLDWNAAVKEESRVGSTLVHANSMSSWKSIADGAFNWDNSTWPGFDGNSWVAASEDIVKYYMDPRNFLDETNVFQFLTHTYDSNSHTVEGLKTMVKGSFLAGESSGNGSSGGSITGPGGGPGVPGSSPGAPGDGSAVPGGSPGAPGDGSAVLGGSPGGQPDSGGSSSGAGSSETLENAAPSSGNTPGISQEPPHASITSNIPHVLMEYGPGASLTGPGADSGGSSNVRLSGSTSYVDIIMNAGTQSGVNPYVLAAMIIQEQGSNGTCGSISGTESGYNGYYNFFNIEAYQSGSMSAVQRGLWWASQPGSYGRPWNSAEKSILGGALFYGNNYVKVGQDTFYLKKFNVQGNNLYKHQYMTNVQGAASEGAVYAKAYNDEMKQTNLEFKIPVYNNMPDNPCSQPTADGNPNNKLLNLSVEGFVMTPTYNRDTLEYNLIVDPSVSGITVNANAIDSHAAVSGSGSIRLQKGANDVRIAVTAQNGSVREYVVHVVRQDNGPTYSSSVGGSTGGPLTAPVDPSPVPGGAEAGGAEIGGAEIGPGAGSGPGAAEQPSGGGAGTPGGSNIMIAPDGSN